MRQLRVMPDYQCSPVWEDAALGNVDLETLPITLGLRERLVRWAQKYDATLDLRQPQDSGFASEAEEAEFEAEGRRLSAALQAELGPEVLVRYWRDPR